MKLLKIKEKTVILKTKILTRKNPRQFVRADISKPAKRLQLVFRTFKTLILQLQNNYYTI